MKIAELTSIPVLLALAVATTACATAPATSATKNQLAQTRNMYATGEDIALCGGAAVIRTNGQGAYCDRLPASAWREWADKQRRDSANTAQYPAPQPEGS